MSSSNPNAHRSFGLPSKKNYKCHLLIFSYRGLYMLCRTLTSTLAWITRCIEKVPLLNKVAVAGYRVTTSPSPSIFSPIGIKRWVFTAIQPEFLSTNGPNIVTGFLTSLASQVISSTRTIIKSTDKLSRPVRRI